MAGDSGEVGELCDSKPSYGDGLIPTCNGKQLKSFQQASDMDQVILERFFIFWLLCGAWIKGKPEYIMEGLERRW